MNACAIVDVPEGKEHLIPENFSALRNDRRWVLKRERSRLAFVNVSWWEFEVLTNELERFSRLVKCNDEVRRTVIRDGFFGVSNLSDCLTIVDRLLKKIKLRE